MKLPERMRQIGRASCEHLPDKDTQGKSPQGANRMAPTARSNRLTSLILFAVVALAPLPFGSTDAVTVAAWCMVLGLAALLATPRQLQKGQFVLLGCASVLTAAYAIVLHEQLSSHPWFSVALPDPVWHEAAAALGKTLPASVSVSRNQPFFAIGASLVCMLSMICSFIVCADRRRAHQLLKLIAWSGAAYAILAIVLFAVDPTRILWREKQEYETVLTGTFINRNTAAVYFGTCGIIWLLLAAEQMRKDLIAGPVRFKLVTLIQADLSRGAKISLAILFICIAATFMTGSRAGIVLSLMALVLATLTRFYRDLPRRRSLLAAALIGGIAALLLLEILGAGVSGRFDAEGLSDEGRFETYRATWRMIAAHPWFGTGLGTFPWIFPAYRTAAVSMWGVWDRAHNTLLEIAAELGLPFAGLVAIGWILILGLLLRGAAIRRRDLIIPAAAFSAAVLAVLHSLIDFSLQIPGYAIVIFALVGAGLAQSFPSSALMVDDAAGQEASDRGAEYSRDVAKGRARHFSR
jgi:O-antigen ligase